jgi:hypothetical protein
MDPYHTINVLCFLPINERDVSHKRELQRRQLRVGERGKKDKKISHL